jgi:pyruvate/2-oxoglutarate/acetoin dehydrogenase E1 component
MGWKPKVIIRVAVGGARPLNPGPQHTQNHTAAFRSMLSMPVLDVSNETVARQYDAAMRIDGSVILVEHMELYGT